MAAIGEAARRIYTEAEIGMLVFVKRCRDLGFPISDIKAQMARQDASDGRIECPAPRELVAA